MTTVLMGATCNSNIAEAIFMTTLILIVSNWYSPRCYVPFLLIPPGAAAAAPAPAVTVQVRTY